MEHQDQITNGISDEDLDRSPAISACTHGGMRCYVSRQNPDGRMVDGQCRDRLRRKDVAGDGISDEVLNRSPAISACTHGGCLVHVSPPKS